MPQLTSVPRVQPGLPTRLASGATIVAALSFLAVWATRRLPQRSAIAHFDQVGALNGVHVPAATPYVVALTVAFILAALFRRRELQDARVASRVIALVLCAVALPLASVLGQQALVLICASVVAVLLGVHVPVGRIQLSPKLERAMPWLLWGGVALMHAAYSMHRHAWYGSGSWDHGCMIHNFYRASRFLSTTSTVLGDVDFLGDHFMIGIYLYAPLSWLNASGYMILLIQAVNLAAAAPALYLMARHHRIRFGPALVLALAGGLSFGLQSAAYFDSHEITVGFGFLAWGLWAFETGRLRTATLLLFTFALFKESLGAYVVGLGLLSLWRAVVLKDRRHLKYGLFWVVAGAVWFVLVNRFFMPTLIARGRLPEPHETFGDFGPTVFEAAVGIVTHPMKALAAVFVPNEKLMSLAVTLGNTGGLALLSPQVGLAALPLFAERFLSSKATMWQMGYHYAAPLCLYAGWASVRGWAAAERAVARGFRGYSRRLMKVAPAVLSIYVALCALGMNGFGYRHPSNYFRWTEGYFANAERKPAHDAAVALIEGQGRDARVAAQNRLLPHLADRPVIYRLAEWEKADWVLLSVGESAWPSPNGYPRRLARQLDRDDGWKLVFSEATTAVFAREGTTPMPGISPASGLGLVSRPRDIDDSQNPP